MCSYYNKESVRLISLFWYTFIKICPQPEDCTTNLEIIFHSCIIVGWFFRVGRKKWHSLTMFAEWQRMAFARFTRLMASRQNCYYMPLSTLKSARAIKGASPNVIKCHKTFKVFRFPLSVLILLRRLFFLAARKNVNKFTFSLAPHRQLRFFSYLCAI